MEEKAIIPIDRLEIIKSSLALITGEASSLTIQNPEDEGTVTTFIGKAVRTKKSLESQRQEAVAPLNKRIKQINDLFRPFTDQLDRARKTAESILIKWKSDEARRILEIQRQAREEAANVMAETGEIPTLAPSDVASVSRTRRLRIPRWASTLGGHSR